MAYGLKYRAGWQGHDGVQGYLDIHEKDYSGSTIDIKLQGDAIELENDFTDTESPIIGFRCSFFVINDKENYFELFELLTATERKFQVFVSVIAPYTADVFQGFLNVDAITHGYLHNQVMYLVASSYLSKLKYLEPASLATIQNVTFINLIDEILRASGSSHNIRVNCKMYTSGDSIDSSQTLFNLNGINTEAFWENDVDRMNSLEVIEAILLPLNCFIYWWDGYWYIEHFTDIWNTQIEFVEYTTGQLYTPISTGTKVTLTRTLEDVHELQFKETSQETNVIPGNRLITVILNSANSLLVNLFAPIAREPNPTLTYVNQPDKNNPWATVLPTLTNRVWTILTGSYYPIRWSGAGQFYPNIKNGIHRYIDYDTRYLGHQLGTSFQVTIDNDTTATLEFTYRELEGELRRVAWEESVDEQKRLQMYIRVWLYFDDGGTRRYIIHQDDSWYTTTDWGDAHDMDYAITVVVNGDDYDKVINGFKISISIPLGEVALDGSSGANYLVTQEIKELNFLLEGEKLYKSFYDAAAQEDEWKSRYLATDCHWGDFHFTVSNDMDFNRVDGSINTDFLNSKEIRFFIGDNQNLNYTNGILRGANLDIKTTSWGRTGVTYRPLIDVFFIEKFRMYNSTKQKITSKTYQTALLPPFSLYEESKQDDKRFICVSYLWTPSEDSNEIILLEYDNDTEVNLIES